MAGARPFAALHAFLRRLGLGGPLIALVYEAGGGFPTLFGVLAALGFTIFLGAVAFPNRPEDVERMVEAGAYV